MTVCLDSWAVLAWLRDEPGAAVIARAVRGHRRRISWVNVVEVLYRVERDRGGEAAARTLAGLRRDCLLDLPDERLMLEVARLEARRRMALGDCFAVATAALHDEILLTGDPEILDAPDLPCLTRDLRARGRSPRRRR